MAGIRPGCLSGDCGEIRQGGAKGRDKTGPFFHVPESVLVAADPDSPCPEFSLAPGHNDQR
jgi:hypothetical protein